jgi:hypothetical protein
MNGVVCDCTTQPHNAHNTSERRVLYDYHLWAGRDVRIDCVVEKSGIAVARSRLIDDVPGLSLEVPLWMFDRLVCSAIRHGGSPQVDMAALSALRFLLTEVADAEIADPQLPSTAPDLRADLLSCDHNQGDVDDPSSHKAGPIRAVRPTDANASDADTALAEPADRDPSQDHEPDGSVVDGARGRCQRGARQANCQSTPEWGER